jgi:lysophospholipase L1-like esterase
MINLNSKKWLLICLSSVFLSACDPNFNSPVGDTSSYSAGDADFSRYVAVGDSLTAGYADSALYRSGQENSFPNILANQFKAVGGGVFNQPLMNDNLGGLVFGATASTTYTNRLVLDAATSSPEPIVGTPTNEVIIGAPILSGTFNNTGVPGAKSFHLGSSGYGSAAGLLVPTPTSNPYFVRFASSTITTVITDAATQAPTFFTLWIGNNDVLSYATGGGIGTDRTGNPDPTTYSTNDITDPAFFAGTYNSLLSALTTNNPAAKGVLINIPNVSSIPYFTTVPYNAIELADDATTTAVQKQDALNAAYASYNGALQAYIGTLLTAEQAAARTIAFSAGTANPLVIIDETLVDLTSQNAALVSMRPATATDLIVLSALTKIKTAGGGSSAPLGDADVLIPSEITAINTARIAYNVTIKAAADADPNLALYDASAFMTELKANGISFGTGDITSTYATGGGFSLDGVHPTARGYSVIANGIIDTINTAFNSSIPRVDPGTYTTIFLK